MSPGDAVKPLPSPLTNPAVVEITVQVTCGFWFCDSCVCQWPFVLWQISGGT